MKSGKKRLIGMTATIVVVLAASAVLLLHLLPSTSKSALSQDPVIKSVPDENSQSADLPGFEEDNTVEPENSAMPTLDTSGRMPASGEFVLSSVAENVDIALANHANELSAIIGAIRSVDAAFSPERYVIRVKDYISTSTPPTRQ